MSRASEGSTKNLLRNKRRQLTAEERIENVMDKLSKYYTDKNQQRSTAMVLAITESVAKLFYDMGIGEHEELKIKIMFSQLSPGTEKTVMSTIASTLSPTTFGAVHTALTFNNAVVDWNASALCKPRQWGSTNAILAVDVATIPKGEIPALITKLSEIIVDWNSNMSYNNLTTNCQAFVEDVLKRINLKLPDLHGGDTLGPLFQELKKHGKIDFSYTVPKVVKTLIKECGVTTETAKMLLETDEVKFKSHEQLDQVVCLIIDLIPSYFNASDKGIEEHMLLKAYDRAFWARYLKSMDVLKDSAVTLEKIQQIKESDFYIGEAKEKALKRFPPEEQVEKKIKDAEIAQELGKPCSIKCFFEDPRGKTMIGVSTRLPSAKQ
jgi:hypothetical protein